MVKEIISQKIKKSAFNLFIENALNYCIKHYLFFLKNSLSGSFFYLWIENY